MLIGTERFQVGTTTSDYSIKSPSKDVYLKDGATLNIDFSPMHPKTKIWGDWSTTIVFNSRVGIDDEQVSFLGEMRQIHRNGISKITATSTGADVVNFYLNEFKQRNITLLDVRNNVGHSIHEGPKDQAHRVWLDQNNTIPLGEGIFAVEPGGVRQKKDGTGIVVTRFEECIYIPKEGKAVILDGKKI